MQAFSPPAPASENQTRDDDEDGGLDGDVDDDDGDDGDDGDDDDDEK